MSCGKKSHLCYLREILVAATADADKHRVALTPPPLLFDDPGDNGRRQSAGCLQHLRLGLATDDRLEIANHARIGRRSNDRTDDVVAVVDVGDPVPDGLAGGVL